jgi:hypothetical protein
MPAHRIEAPFSDKEVAMVIRSMKKTGAPKKKKGIRKLPARSVDRALLRLRDANEIRSEMRRWFPA